MFFFQSTGSPQPYDATQTQTWKQQQAIYIFNLGHVQGLLKKCEKKLFIFAYLLIQIVGSSVVWMIWIMMMFLLNEDFTERTQLDKMLSFCSFYGTIFLYLKYLNIDKNNKLITEYLFHYLCMWQVFPKISNLQWGMNFVSQAVNLSGFLEQFTQLVDNGKRPHHHGKVVMNVNS